MLQDKVLPWCQKHRKLITLSTVALGMIFLLIYGRFHSTPEEFAINFALPAAYTLLALIPGYFIVETVGKGLLKLKERIDYGLEHKTILLAGDKSECDKVQAQLHYSQLLNKNNITNEATLITVETPKYDCNLDTFTKYDLVILCFMGENGTPISNEQTQLLSDTLATIGDDKILKDDIEVGNSEDTVVGLIVLCPPSSLKEPKYFGEADLSKHIHDTKPFQRPFTVVVNQIGRMMTDIFSLLTTLPPRNGD